MYKIFINKFIKTAEALITACLNDYSKFTLDYRVKLSYSCRGYNPSAIFSRIKQQKKAAYLLLNLCKMR